MIVRKYHYVLRQYTDNKGSYTQRCGIVSVKSWKQNPEAASNKICEDYANFLGCSPCDIQLFRMVRL